jgi:hypothetical protein
MIKSVVRQFNWSPEVIDNLYMDGNDYKGLVYWYRDVVEVNEKLRQKK